MVCLRLVSLIDHRRRLLGCGAMGNVAFEPLRRWLRRSHHQLSAVNICPGYPGFQGATIAA